MAARLPDRYELEIRLGRDGDIEEWLANDDVLDRPVLVRMLGPEVNAERRRHFLGDVRSLGSVSHPHLLEVYAAGSDGGHTWMVGEWTGGVTIADRLAAGETMPVDEFLSNAAGLASALGELHDRGVVHGAIDTKAVSFSAGHPAKLTSFARSGHGLDPSADVADLAAVLSTALTGIAGQSPPPSQLTDGLDPGVDDILEAASRGKLTAEEFAARLRATPGGVARGVGQRWAWRWLIPAGTLGLLVFILTLFGPFRSSDETAPFALPDPPTTTVTLPPPSTTTTTVVEPVRVVLVDVLDPSADGERDGELPNLIDGDPSTAWRTERYFAPLQLVKAGVGVTFVLDRPAGVIAFVATPATAWEVRWAASLPQDLTGWEVVANGVVPPSIEPVLTTVDLPPRESGIWLLWLTDLAPQGQSEDDPPRDFYFSFIYEVRFSP